MNIKPITLWGYSSGSNPWKVAMVLKELDVPYNVKMLSFPDMKTKPYTSLNPNGRVAMIEDPNSGTTLWESGAIIDYLIEMYDEDNRISFERGSKEYYEAKQWMYHQVSGTGPHFGQAVWLTLYHPEKIPSAVPRYVDGIRRVSGVLNGFLEDKEYLVGHKFTHADAVFVTWYSIICLFSDKSNLETDFPTLYRWLERLKERPKIDKGLRDREAAMDAAKGSVKVLK